MEIWVYNQVSDTREIVQIGDEDVAIGRDDANKVVLRSPFVSRQHARIFHENGSYFVESLSVNETLVANNPLAHRQKRKIDYGDEIRIAEFSLYMMEPSIRRVHGTQRVVSARKRVVELEQKMHAELLEKLNRRPFKKRCAWLRPSFPSIKRSAGRRTS